MNQRIGASHSQALKEKVSYVWGIQSLKTTLSLEYLDVKKKGAEYYSNFSIFKCNKQFARIVDTEWNISSKMWWDI